MALDKSMEIFERIKKIIAEELKVGEEKVTMDSRIVEDLGAESIDMISLLMELEDEFKSNIPFECAEKFIRIKDVVEYIQTNYSA